MYVDHEFVKLPGSITVSDIACPGNDPRTRHYLFTNTMIETLESGHTMSMATDNIVIWLKTTLERVLNLGHSGTQVTKTRMNLERLFIRSFTHNIGVVPQGKLPATALHVPSGVSELVAISYISLAIIT